MKGYVDPNVCVGCGACAASAPEAFRMNADGLAEGFQEIPAESIDDARDAMADCPVGAIAMR